MIDYLCLFFAFIASLGLLWHKITRNYSVKNHDVEITSEKKDGLLQRRLGNLEQGFAMFGLDGPGVVVSAIIINSEVSLEPSFMRKALVLVNKRFPLLRMTIFRNNDNTLWFKEMADPSRIAFEVCQDYTASQWVEVFESESRVDFDIEKGPLWRVTLLKEEYNNEQQLYTNSLVFSVSHAICDGTSRMAINSQLLEYLNDLHQGKDVHVESRPLLPPLTYLLRSKLQLSTLEKLIFTVLPTIMWIKSKFVKPGKNMYLETYKAPILQNPSIVKRTSLVTRVISADNLSKIAKIGKEHGCTVHSVITAATRLAIAKILKMGSTNTDCNNKVLPDPLKFSTSFNVAIRSKCEPVVEQNEVGCFISLAMMNIETPCLMKVTPKAFWEYARACKDAVAEKISKGEHFQFSKFFSSIKPDVMSSLMKGSFSADESSAGRADGLFNISNLGRFTIGKDQKGGPFQIQGVYAASAEQRVGPLFGHNMVSINGVLYWGMSYFPHVTTKQQAEDFLDMSISILKDSCA